MEQADDWPSDIVSRTQVAWLPLAIPLAGVLMALCAMLILSAA